MIDKRRGAIWLTAGVLSFVMSACWMTLLTFLVANINESYTAALNFLSSWTSIHSLQGATNFINFILIYLVIAIVINLIMGGLYLRISTFENTKFTLYKGRLCGILAFHFAFGGFFTPIFVAIACSSSIKVMRKHANEEIAKNLPFDIDKISQQIKQVKRAYFLGDIATKDEYMRQINLILDSYSK